MGWMGSEIGCRGQNLLLILDLWGSLRSQGPQSGLCAPWPPCPPPLIPTAPGQAFPLSQLTPGSPDSVPPGRECVPQGWHWMGVRYANEFLCDSGPSLWSPKGQGTFYILITSSHCLNTCGPILSKKDLRLLSSSAPPCPRLVPEGPCGTLSCNPCPLQVPTGLSLLLRLLPQQGTGKLCVGPWPAGHSLPDLNSLPWLKQWNCGAKPEPSGEGRPAPHPTPPSLLLQTLPRLPPASLQALLHPPV